MGTKEEWVPNGQFRTVRLNTWDEIAENKDSLNN